MSSSLTSAKVTTMRYILKDVISNEKIKEFENGVEEKIMGITRKYIDINIFSISG